MQGTLVLTILTVQSSYIREIEEPVNNDTDVPDTVQWWIAPTGSWRIKTFAMDHDIHTYAIGDHTFPIENDGELRDLAQERHYWNVMHSQHFIELADCLDREEIVRAFRAEGLEPRVEICFLEAGRSRLSHSV